MPQKRRSKSPAPKRQRDSRTPEKQRVFKELDKNHNGTLSIDEVEAALVHLGLSTATLQELFDEADADGSGEIDFEEYQTIVDSSEAWAAVYAKTSADILGELFDVGEQVLAPLHVVIRRQSSAPASVQGYTKPAFLVRAIGFCFALFDMSLLVPVVAVAAGFGRFFSGSPDFMMKLLFALPLLWLWWRVQLWGRGCAHFGHWLFNLTVLSCESGEPVGFGYMLARSILTFIFWGLSVGVMFAIDTLLVMSGGQHIVDRLLGGEVVCRAPVKIASVQDHMNAQLKTRRR